MSRYVKAIVSAFGFVPGGCSNKESANDYQRVLQVPGIRTNHRLVVCKDELQIIHQHHYGGRWRNLSYFATAAGYTRGERKFLTPQVVEVARDLNRTVTTL